MSRREKRAPAGGAAGGRWRLRNWHLRTKLFVVLLIPALAVVALVGLRVKSDLDDAKALAELAARGRIDNTVTEVIHQLQRERDLTVRYVAAGRKGDIAELQNQRQRVDMAIGTFDRTLVDSRSRLAANAAESLRLTEDRLGVLTGLRYSSEHSQFPSDAVLRAYSELIAGILDISGASAADIADPELARLRLATNALARTKDQMSVKRAVLADALALGKLTNDRTRALLGAEAEIDSAQRDFRTFANPDQQRMYNDTVIGLVVDLGNNLSQSALTRAEGDGDGDLGGLDPNVWDTSSTYTINLVHQVQQALLVQMQNRTDSLAAGARTSAITDSGIVLAVLLVAGVLSVIIARSLLRPLRVLRRSALEVAEHRLPAVVEGILNAQEPQPENVLRRLEVAPVPVFSREELGQVARAFDAVHGEAVRLAGEQALLRENVNSMFVNLSRRSQDLVERQLSVLDRMEADEQDPDTLGGLFELDHLATRMRRNSENLLVLSGTDLGRIASGAVVADEIVGAALSEVEHYQRIELNPAPEIAVRGEAVNDLVHVVSELLENATRYSPEQTIVTVGSSLTPAGAWRIEIADRGAGMPQAEIDRANKRLESPPEVDVEVSRRMGLYVVATLAKRHNIDVRLAAAEGGGLIATVLVPSGLVTEPPPPLELPPPPPIEQPVAEEEPPAFTPLAPLLSEPEPLMLPTVEETPRRAPVVEEYTPSWPVEEEPEAHHLDADAPTERMPAYQDVLSRWFQAGPPSRPVLAPVDRAGAAPEPVWPSEEAWPTESDVDFAGDNEATSPALPIARTSGEEGVQWPPEPMPILSLSPDAVRERMSSLQGGVRRGRHARGEEDSAT
ncbi:nitrate- and nitrite sensing domain-containing protein [Amycolatopsis sp. cg5]|uniref:nitrate- and nitrite sensing domain-containing protein n=1 Tax=Amycolatopsis sp. cg5 TaxID=3238802 RepID=UPI0035232F24